VLGEARDPMRLKTLGFLAFAALVVTALLVLGWRFDQRRRADRLRGVDVASCPKAIPLERSCGRCIAAYCCAEITACYGAPDCIDLNDCWVECGEEQPRGVSREDCPRACEAKHHAAAAAFHAWDSCARKHCEDVCPRGPEDEDEEQERKEKGRR
jgi:hypothetical protein